MIDIKLVRENPQLFKDGAKAKRFDVDIDALLELDSKIMAAKQMLQDIVTEKNRIGKEIPKLPAQEKQAVLAELSKLKEKEAALNDELKRIQPEFDALMLEVPQPPSPEVPLGMDDTENVELYKRGEIRTFDFEPKDHIQLGQALDMIDMERGVKLAGTRNYFLKGEGAMLHRAVMNFAMDFMIGRGYTPMIVPLLMRNEAMRGTGYFPGSEEQTYQMERDELNLVGTAEVPLTAYYMNEMLTEKQLPVKFVAMSSCFRREAGAAGKDTYGLYRIHQFDKVEQVIIGENDEQKSIQYHQEILGNSEAVLQALG